jgi:hypothetical protein
MPVNRASCISGGCLACYLSCRDSIGRKERNVSTAVYIRRSKGNKNDLYVLGKITEEGSRVLCVTPASGIKTLPLFSDREAARRFLRATPLRFGLLGSGWRPRRLSSSELDSLLLVGLPADIRVIALDLPLEDLLGECSTQPIPEVA